MPGNDKPENDEPSFSTKPTRRDVSAAVAVDTRRRTPRGEFNVGGARSVASDEISGTIGRRGDTKAPPLRSRRGTGSSDLGVHVASATKRELTVIINGEPLTLERQDALALAAIITTTFE